MNSSFCEQVFSTYPFLTGSDLTPNVLFTTYILISQLHNPLVELPKALSSLANAMVATKRLAHFFTLPEIETRNKRSREEENGVPKVRFPHGSYKVKWFFNNLWK